MNYATHIAFYLRPSCTLSKPVAIDQRHSVTSFKTRSSLCGCQSPRSAGPYELGQTRSTGPHELGQTRSIVHTNCVRHGCSRCAGVLVAGCLGYAGAVSFAGCLGYAGAVSFAGCLGYAGAVSFAGVLAALVPLTLLGAARPTPA